MELKHKNILRVRDNVHLQLFDQFGNLKVEHWSCNLVTTAGLYHIADRLSTTPGQSAMSHMAIGSDDTSPVAGDTALGSELGRVALDSCTDASGVVTYVATFPANTGTGDLTEAGILNAASTGTLLARTTFTSTEKQALDILIITWTLSMADDGA